LDRAAARRGRLGLLAQQVRGEVPADDDDLRGPGDAGAAPQRPAAVGVAAVRGVDADDAPAALAPALAVDAEARAPAPPVQPAGQQVVDHGRSSRRDVNPVPILPLLQVCLRVALRKAERYAGELT